MHSRTCRTVRKRCLSGGHVHDKQRCGTRIANCRIEDVAETGLLAELADMAEMENMGSANCEGMESNLPTAVSSDVQARQTPRSKTNPCLRRERIMLHSHQP